MDSRFFSNRGTVTQHDIKFVIIQEIRDTEQELEQCNVEIIKLEGPALMAMERRRDEVDKRLKGYKSLLAPVNRMPPEVLVEIFEFCCSGSSCIERHDGYDSLRIPVPLRLAMVCGRWRELAVSTPSLWAGLKITGRGPPEYFPNMLRALKLFIERSKAHPLVIHAEDSPTFTSDAFEALVPASDRWEYLHLTTNHITSRRTTLHPIRTRLSNLRRLVLRPSDLFNDGVYDEDFFRVFEIAPSLHSITLQNSLVTPRLSLPWQQLDSVTLELCSLNRARQVLSLTTNVRHLTLKWSYLGSLGSNQPQGHLTLVKLDTFSADVREAGVMSNMFQQTDLPNLRVLDLHNPGVLEDWNVPWDISALKTILHTPSTASSLTHLKMRFMPVSDGDMISFLRLTRSLTTLVLWELGPPRKELRKRPRNLTITTPFLRQLSYPDDPAAAPEAALFLPRLTELGLHIHAEGLDQHALVHAILSRSSHRLEGSGAASIGSRLRSTEITVVNRKRGNTFDDLHSLKRLGLDAGMEVCIMVSNAQIVDEEDDNGED